MRGRSGLWCVALTVCLLIAGGAGGAGGCAKKTPQQRAQEKANKAAVAQAKAEKKAAKKQAEAQAKAEKKRLAEERERAEAQAKADKKRAEAQAKAEKKRLADEREKAEAQAKVEAKKAEQEAEIQRDKAAAQARLDRENAARAERERAEAEKRQAKLAMADAKAEKEAAKKARKQKPRKEEPMKYEDDAEWVVGHPYSRPENRTWQVDRHAQAMAAVGAAGDTTLYDHHFDGGELSSLGRTKVALMLQAAPKNEPLTVYVPTSGSDERVQARLAAVENFSKQSQWAAIQVQARQGVDTRITTPASVGLSGLRRMETNEGQAGNAASDNQPARGSMSGSTGGGQ